MPKRIYLIALVLLAMTLLSACQPLIVDDAAMAGSDTRRVQGEIFLPAVPQWGGVVVSIDFDFSEVDPDTHEATGYINWHNVMPNVEEGQPTWKGVESQVRYVFFGDDADDGDENAVAIITQIVSKEGWGQGEPGEYAYFWMRDGGDESLDQWGNLIYSGDPFYEFFPEDEPPIEGGYFTFAELQAANPILPLVAELGDIEIVRPALDAATE